MQGGEHSAGRQAWLGLAAPAKTTPKKTWDGLYAEVVYETGRKTMVALYRKETDADESRDNALLLIPLDNEQMTELLNVQGIKPCHWES